jgi:hypothetical protein
MNELSLKKKTISKIEPRLRLIIRVNKTKIRKSLTMIKGLMCSDLRSIDQ